MDAPTTLDRIYLDFNATSPLRPVAFEQGMEAMRQGGNASSIHAEGRRARSTIERARRAVADLVGVAADLVTFTSGATEAAALALTPDLTDGAGPRPARLLIGATEHPAVSRGHRFAAAEVSIIPVGGDGVVDLNALEAMLDAGAGPVIVALQAANGETGVLQPIAAVADLVHRHGGLMVCDAAQAAGRIDCRASTLRADILLLSGHKIGGPQGAGAMVRTRATVSIGTPLVRGGGQERGLRGGTENGPAIAGFGAAAREIGSHDDAPRLAELRDRLERHLIDIAPDLVIFGRAAPRLPNTMAFAVPGLVNDTALIALDLAGLAVSTGSACSSGKVSRSEVLEAMGVDDHLKGGMIRVSLGWSSSLGHVDRFADAFAGIVTRVRARPVRAAA